ncbi:MAG: DciA family protein [Candidatus Omnitrophica bacterium]|nr:DciA family protein [Candidatus Omnitrophota bacterium]
MGKERTKQKSIDNIVKDVIKNLSGAGRVSEEDVVGAWAGAAGAKAAKHTKPVSIKKGVMTINVDGSGWLYELTVKKKELLEKLGGKIKGKQVKALRFRIGEIK